MKPTYRILRSEMIAVFRDGGWRDYVARSGHDPADYEATWAFDEPVVLTLTPKEHECDACKACPATRGVIDERRAIADMLYDEANRLAERAFAEERFVGGAAAIFDAESQATVRAGNMVLARANPAQAIHVVSAKDQPTSGCASVLIRVADDLGNGIMLLPDDAPVTTQRQAASALRSAEAMLRKMASRLST